ncbi:MAG: DNA polymerase I, partial [Clostridia bacterium]|nr:DNA polymerase I [Clostridia bacterium]
MQKLILIDGNSLLNRAFYATPPLTTKEGVPTNAVFAFVNMLLRVIGEKKPTHLLVAFDRKEPTFRHQMYDGYKQGRKPMPDDLVPQVPLMKEVLHAMGICTYEQAGIEADDIIGAAAKRFSLSTDIYTGDKDSFQLVDQTTTVCFTKRGVHETEDYTAENFTEKTGLTPCQIIDLKSLMGDASDRIPGVPGVGEKTAKDLLTTYGSLNGVYENIGAIKGKLKEKLEQNQDSAYLSYRLATIDTGVELPLTLNDLAFHLPLPASAKEIFRSLQFFTFLKKENLFTEGEDIPAETQEIQATQENEQETIQETKIAKTEEVSLKQTVTFTSASEIATAFASAKKLTF